MKDLNIDVTAIVGVIAMAVIGTMAVDQGADGMTVAAGVAGGIAGWLAKGATRVTTKAGDDPSVTTTTDSGG